MYAAHCMECFFSGSVSRIENYGGLFWVEMKLCTFHHNSWVLQCAANSGNYFSISSWIRLKVPINPVGGGIWLKKTCDEITSLEAWARVGAFAVWFPLLKLWSVSMRAFPIKVKLTLRNNPVVVGKIFAPEPVDHVYNVAIWIIPGTNPRWMNWTEFQVVVGLNSSIQEM